MDSHGSPTPRKFLRVPLSTYRLQLNGEFRFRQAASILPYLAELGIADVYASPIMQAGAESTHGYDVCSFEQLSSGLGGSQGFKELADALRQHGLGLLLDIVPNHMGNDLSNSWWYDVLEHGQGSRFANFFDIDWERVPFPGKVLLPILEDHYFRVLYAGKLKLAWREGRFVVSYYDRHLPVALGSYADILAATLEACCKSPTETNLVRSLQALLHVISGASPDLASTLPEFQRIRAQLAAWEKEFTEFPAALGRTLDRLNGVPGDEATFAVLDRILRQQHYRLAFWRVSTEELNYRRFFDVTQLISLRMERPEVFQAVHRLALDLVHRGVVTGLRIDHPDGLRDPGGYLRSLQRAVRNTSGCSADLDFYVVVEKILTGRERLRPDWPVAGTTGYDFLNLVNAVFIDSHARAELDSFYHEFTGSHEPFDEVVYRSKKLILQTSLVSEMNALAERARKLAADTVSGRDLTLAVLRSALQEVIAGFPTYRSYLDLQTTEVPAVEAAWIESAIKAACLYSPATDPVAFDFLESVLLLKLGKLQPQPRSPNFKASVLEFVLRFQQLTGPATAKGLEDTTFYNYYRFISLNEVGGDPSSFGISVADFHALTQSRAAHWPHTMLATATHDTKRGEDVRARLSVISEMVPEWKKAVSHWAELNQGAKRLIQGNPAPSANDEYLLYQTLLGAWPVEPAEQELAAFQERMAAYLTKALREGKANTSWTDPNAEYESATIDFLRTILDPSASETFLRNFRELQGEVAFFGFLNSLSQLVLKLGSPGVSDIYQGTEHLDLSLVDPDNRRPVDFNRRIADLAEVKSWRTVSRSSWDFAKANQLKLFVLWKCLHARRNHAQLFQQGSYEPIRATGTAADHLVAFARRSGPASAVIVVPRLVRRLLHSRREFPLGAEVWGDTSLDITGSYINIFTGLTVKAPCGNFRAGELFESCPVAILIS